SYQIRLLEERLGVPLFHRIKRQVKLTETGRRIAPLVSGAFDGLDDAFGIARSDSESVLTISCSNTFASNWLALRLGSFQMQRPGLAVRLDTTDRVVDFAHDEVDVAIRNSVDAWPGLVSHFLMRVPIAPLASPALIARYGPFETPEDVMRAPRVSPDDTWWGRWLDAAGGNAATLAPRAGVRMDSQVMDGNAAIAGQGIAILNAALWWHEMRTGRLVQPTPDVAFSRGRYWLVYPEHRRNAAKVKAFREWMLGEMRADAADGFPGAFEAVDIS
ncbi:MAG: LysR substrate-binding domain-containing protein, partial [Pseudomonadota bacterium]|nr:LysR substrate-binding domain-containing protein [Pseudomonadota bacterium]